MRFILFFSDRERRPPEKARGTIFGSPGFLS